MRYTGIWTKIVCITGTTKQSRHLSGSHIDGGDAYSEVFLDSPPCKDGMCQEGHCWLTKKTKLTSPAVNTANVIHVKIQI